MLNPTREQRDATVSFMRQRATDPLFVIGIGREADASGADDYSCWDKKSQEALDQKLCKEKAELDQLEMELVAIVANEAQGSCRDSEWKLKTEKMHRLGVRFYALKVKEMANMMAKASVICMTVDAFTQMASAGSMTSLLFANIRWELVIVDEAHQLLHGVVAAVASEVETMMLFYDEAQSIDFGRASSAMQSQRGS